MAEFSSSTPPGSLPSLGPGVKLAIYHHPACEQHDISNHPEQPRRVASILTHLRREWPEDLFFREVAAKATDEQLLLFHTQKHVDLFKSKCDKVAEGKAEVVAYDSDTQVMCHTRDAAYYAAGAMIESIDALFLPEDNPQQVTTAFCAVRPPGHHAERNRAMGFCFFSNAAIGAKYAQSKYGVERVAVLDFDVHHGNGTEEGFRPHDSLFYGSTHQFEAYPGTGKDPSPKVGELAALEINRRIVNRYLVTDQAQSTQKQFRTKWRQVVEEMVRFRPGLVIFSAGFDAHDADPLADCELQEEDFSWATDIVLEACVRINPEAPPKCVSILEGGYDLEALGLSAAAHVRSLAKGFPVTPAPVAATAVAGAADGADGEAPVKPEVVGDEVAALAKFLKDVGL